MRHVTFQPSFLLNWNLLFHTNIWLFHQMFWCSMLLHGRNVCAGWSAGCSLQQAKAGSCWVAPLPAAQTFQCSSRLCWVSDCAVWKGNNGIVALGRLCWVKVKVLYVACKRKSETDIPLMSLLTCQYKSPICEKSPLIGRRNCSWTFQKKNVFPLPMNVFFGPMHKNQML